MCQCVQPLIFDNQKYLLFVCAYIGLCMKCIQVIGILYMNFCSWLWTFIKHLKCHWKNNQFAVMRKPFFFGFCFWITSPNSDFSVQSHLFLSPIGAWTLKMPVLYPPSNVGAYTRTPSPTMPMFSSVQSHLFLSQIGAQTLKMPVPYPPPSVGVYTQTPSHQPLVFGRKGTDHLP